MGWVGLGGILVVFGGNWWYWVVGGRGCVALREWEGVGGRGTWDGRLGEGFRARPAWLRGADGWPVGMEMGDERLGGWAELVVKHAHVLHQCICILCC